MTLEPNLYAARRAKLASLMAAHSPNSIAIIPTAPERQRNRDSDYLYRHDSYFYYLTGFSEPNACLVLSADGRSTLFCQPKDMEREIWDGLRLGPDAALSQLAVHEAWPSAVLDAKLPALIENKAVVWYPFATHSHLPALIESGMNAVRARVRYGALCPTQQRDVCDLLDEMRLVKDEHELNLMRRASQISAGAHIRAMKRSAAMLRAGQDVREFHLDAELLHEFRQHGFEPGRTEVRHLFGNLSLARLAPDHGEAEEDQPDEQEDAGHAEVPQLLLDVDVAPSEPTEENERSIDVGTQAFLAEALANERHGEQ
jgi:Xaa-Pro aminopeptidase